METTRLDFDGEDRFQRLRQELGVTTFGLNLLRLRPKQQGRIHRHEQQEEVYLVLDGVLTLEAEGEMHELAKGELVRVPPETRRRLSNRGAEPLFLLALGGAQPHEGRDGRAYESWDETGPGRPPQEVPVPQDLD
jgi:mannose-6-phosphate isomerase-like protein (cupin superfamily)